ncbi:hypothetical protein B0H14DRAFT_3130246 [Mycena olivaceomarginata]|nr:hypothetical protein B0H14DRAFT_3130246 [Mycena olivaceomarginata]
MEGEEEGEMAPNYPCRERPPLRIDTKVALSYVAHSTSSTISASTLYSSTSTVFDISPAPLQYGFDSGILTSHCPADNDNVWVNCTTRDQFVPTHRSRGKKIGAVGTTRTSCNDFGGWRQILRANSIAAAPVRILEAVKSKWKPSPTIGYYHSPPPCFTTYPVERLRTRLLPAASLKEDDILITAFTVSMGWLFVILILGPEFINFGGYRYRWPAIGEEHIHSEPEWRQGGNHVARESQAITDVLDEYE